MKKLLLLSILASFISIQCNAQNDPDYRKQLMFGLKAGVNSSNVYDSRGEAFVASSKTGFVGGAFLSIPIGQFLGIQPEVLYSQKGFQATGSFLGSPYNLTRTTSYIDVPLLITVKPANFMTLLAGPQFSYLLNQKDVLTNSSTSTQQQQEFKNDNIRKNILCFLGGIDFNFDHMVFGARAGWDLSNNNGDGTSTTPRYKNVWLQGTIGVRF
ncbi:hypothetical protein WSM22_45670 [Cytophagales bacterium WSM2-2]|nr:hypothetical protein WSM22_45670 [Cytophagales bacterium WSM2-2]